MNSRPFQPTQLSTTFIDDRTDKTYSIEEIIDQLNDPNEQVKITKSEDDVITIKFNGIYKYQTIITESELVSYLQTAVPSNADLLQKSRLTSSRGTDPVKLIQDFILSVFRGLKSHIANLITNNLGNHKFNILLFWEYVASGKIRKYNYSKFPRDIFLYLANSLTDLEDIYNKLVNGFGDVITHICEVERVSKKEHYLITTQPKALLKVNLNLVPEITYNNSIVWRLEECKESNCDEFASRILSKFRSRYICLHTNQTMNVMHGFVFPTIIDAENWLLVNFLKTSLNIINVSRGLTSDVNRLFELPIVYKIYSDIFNNVFKVSQYLPITLRSSEIQYSRQDTLSIVSALTSSNVDQNAAINNRNSPTISQWLYNSSLLALRSSIYKWNLLHRCYVVESDLVPIYLDKAENTSSSITLSVIPSGRMAVESDLSTLLYTSIRLQSILSKIINPLKKFCYIPLAVKFLLPGQINEFPDDDEIQDYIYSVPRYIDILSSRIANILTNASNTILSSIFELSFLKSELGVNVYHLGLMSYILTKEKPINLDKGQDWTILSDELIFPNDISIFSILTSLDIVTVFVLSHMILEEQEEEVVVLGIDNDRLVDNFQKCLLVTLKQNNVGQIFSGSFDDYFRVYSPDAPLSVVENYVKFNQSYGSQHNYSHHFYDLLYITRIVDMNNIIHKVIIPNLKIIDTVIIRLTLIPELYIAELYYAYLVIKEAVPDYNLYCVTSHFNNYGINASMLIFTTQTYVISAIQSLNELMTNLNIYSTDRFNDDGIINLPSTIQARQFLSNPLSEKVEIGDVMMCDFNYPSRSVASSLMCNMCDQVMVQKIGRSNMSACTAMSIISPKDLQTLARIKGYYVDDNLLPAIESNVQLDETGLLRNASGITILNEIMKIRWVDIYNRTIEDGKINVFDIGGRNDEGLQFALNNGIYVNFDPSITKLDSNKTNVFYESVEISLNTDIETYVQKYDIPNDEVLVLLMINSVTTLSGVPYTSIIQWLEYASKFLKAGTLRSVLITLPVDLDDAAADYLLKKNLNVSVVVDPLSVAPEIRRCYKLATYDPIPTLTIDEVTTSFTDLELQGDYMTTDSAGVLANSRYLGYSAACDAMAGASLFTSTMRLYQLESATSFL